MQQTAPYLKGSGVKGDGGILELTAYPAVIYHVSVFYKSRHTSVIEYRTFGLCGSTGCKHNI